MYTYAIAATTMTTRGERRSAHPRVAVYIYKDLLFCRLKTPVRAQRSAEGYPVAPKAR